MIIRTCSIKPKKYFDNTKNCSFRDFFYGGKIQMIHLNYAFLLLIFTFSLKADSVQFSDGKKLEDVKIFLNKESVEILFKNGRREIHNKKTFKKSKIKIIPVAWFKKESPDQINSSKESRQAKINQQMLILEQQREANFALSQKVIEERKRHDFLMKERIRLQYTEGNLTYAGGQTIYTEIMEKNGNRFFVRNPYGLLYFTSKDFGEEIIIETDKGKEKVDISKMLSVKEEKFRSGYIYLASGEKFKGTILRTLGEQVVIDTTKGEMKLTASEIIFPSISVNKNKDKINLKEGDYGSFLFENGETIQGKLIKVSKNFLLIETEYGRIEMDFNNLNSFSKEDSKK